MTFELLTQVQRISLTTVIGAVVCSSTVVTDGVTITGDGSPSNPLVAAGAANSLLIVNNLSDVASATTSLRNIGGLPKITTWAAKAGDYTLQLSDFDDLTGLEMSAVANAVTVPPNSVAIPVGSIIYGITLDGAVTTITPGSGVTILSSSGAMTIDSGTGNLFLWSLQKRATNTWYLYNGAPSAVSPLNITFNAQVSTVTNMPSALTEWSGVGVSGRYRTKVDLTNYTQIRVTVGCSLAGFSGAGFFVQYSTDDSSFTTIGSGSGTDTATVTSTGTRVSDWITIPAGAKADVFLRLVMANGNDAADPVVGLIMAQVR